MKAAVYTAAVLFAYASRGLCVAGLVLFLLRIFGLVPVPYWLSLSLMLSPLVVVLIYLLIGRIEAPPIEPNAGGE